MLDREEVFQAHYEQKDIKTLEIYAYYLGTDIKVRYKVFQGIYKLLEFEDLDETYKQVEDLVLLSPYHQEREIAFIYSMLERQKLVRICCKYNLHDLFANPH